MITTRSTYICHHTAVAVGPTAAARRARTSSNDIISVHLYSICCTAPWLSRYPGKLYRPRSDRHSVQQGAVRVRRGQGTGAPPLLFLPPPPPSCIPRPLTTEWGIVSLHRQVEEGTILGRVGRVEECAGTVAYLCSQDAAYVTAETIVVAGGMPSRL